MLGFLVGLIPSQPDNCLLVESEKIQNRGPFGTILWKIPSYKSD